MLNKNCVERYLESSRFLILCLRSFFLNDFVFAVLQLASAHGRIQVLVQKINCSHCFHDGLELLLSFFRCMCKNECVHVCDGVGSRRMSVCMCVMELVHLLWVCAHVWWSWFTSYWTCTTLSQVGRKITADSELELFVVLAILFCLYVWQVCECVCIKQCILQDAERLCITVKRVYCLCVRRDCKLFRWFTRVHSLSVLQNIVCGLQTYAGWFDVFLQFTTWAYLFVMWIICLHACYIHALMCVHTHTHTHIHTLTNAHTHTHTHLQMHTYTHTHRMHAHMHARAHTHTHTHTHIYSLSPKRAHTYTH